MADLETILLSATASLSALLIVNVVTYHLNRRKERAFERAKTEYSLKMTRYEKTLGLLYSM
jgi:hypothetical protein